MIMIIATFGQAVSGNAPAVNIIGVLVVWRFIVRFLSFPFIHLSNYLHRWVSVLEEIILFRPSFPPSLLPPKFVVG